MTTLEPKPTEPKPAEPAAPTEYKFTAPEGKTIDATLVERATPLFRDLKLDQAGAQKLVDLYNDLSGKWVDNSLKAVKDMRDSWVSAVKSDPEMGGKLDQIKTDIGKFKNLLFEGDSKALKEFNDAVDLTGAGDHPAIVRGLWKAAQRVLEGTHVSGSSPSPHGQKAPGQSERPSLAQAMYPNLSH